jgi:hypothetical protein
MNQHDLTKQGELRRKIKVWARLQNEHILPLLGLCRGYGALPGLVSPWMDNGSLMYFLYRSHKTLTRYERFRLVGNFVYDWTHNLPVFSWKILPRRYSIVRLLFYGGASTSKSFYQCTL